MSSLASTTGDYTVRLDLNAAIESESNGGTNNDAMATAQTLNGFISLGGVADRAVVRGRGAADSGDHN